MLWEHKRTGECFHNSLEFSQTFMIVSIRQLDYELEISLTHRNGERIIHCSDCFSVNLLLIQNFI